MEDQKFDEKFFEQEYLAYAEQMKQGCFTNFDMADCGQLGEIVEQSKDYELAFRAFEQARDLAASELVLKSFTAHIHGSYNKMFAIKAM